MIRPLTVASFLLACGSGLYLYQSKHEVQVLDRTIEHTLHDTNVLRDQSRLLAAEWTMLNDPERLRQFSDTYLNLHTITPGQFTSLADLNNRLPAPRAETPAPAADENAPTPVAAEAPVQPIQAVPVETPPVAVAGDVAPPAHAPAPVIAPPTRLAEHKVPVHRPPVGDAATPRPVAVAEARPFEQHPARVAEVRNPDVRLAEQRPLPPLPRPVVASAAPPLPVSTLPSRPVAAPPPPYGGSLLGMARSTAPASPRPTPVNATQWSNAY